MFFITQISFCRKVRVKLQVYACSIFLCKSDLLNYITGILLQLLAVCSLAGVLIVAKYRGNVSEHVEFDVPLG